MSQVNVNPPEPKPTGSQVNVNQPVAGPGPARDENAGTAATRTFTWALATAIVGAVLAIAIIYVLPSLMI
ncbi:MAG TPA: hypothetical protein VKF37_05730 [Chloroflexota bacterium]|nr:hypothetical protein [Chloroflexota bacterium]